MTDPLDRIAAALERLSPPPSPPVDLRAHPAYVWRDGALVAARAFAPLPLDRLIGIDRQKTSLTANLDRLAKGTPRRTCCCGVRAARASLRS